MSASGGGASAVAQVYADALFAIGNETGAADDLRAELDLLRDILRANPDLKTFLEAPGISLKKKTQVAEAVLGEDFSETFRNFVAIAIEKRRIAFLDEVAVAMARLSDLADDRLRAQVFSAVELSPERQDAVRELVAKRSGKREVVLISKVDPAIIGGLIIQYGDTYLDSSVQGRLAVIRHSLQSQGGLI